MQLSRFAILRVGALCLAGAMLGPGPAQALSGCFCSRQIEADRICGDILKFDRDSIIVIKPWAKGRRTLDPSEFAECRDQTLDAPPPLQCAAGQVASNGQCVAVPASPAADGKVPPPTPAVAPKTPTPMSSVPPRDDERFGIAGSNTIGEKLMPALIEAFGRSQGFVPYGTACAETDFRLRKGPWTLSIACSSHGTRTGIPAL